eukprot:CAMPEP_0118677090 /NCGR_PEP_ID=MMETSP0800-20121206/2424_1 /TAXON_ID=210618 ORGANISM="Striatella unipunctata, Strain CCMP2910" /NCGR_SAMPLE_ID=MMETSP0800 /ASSEMBLY_ACC=CAM_ASM_000638 /LENGTH=582 /DNA_ID=CAMNT_0006572705 /DNA_START=86 /DNA_END=1834 /DNA_ORIENTATION=+
MNPATLIPANPPLQLRRAVYVRVGDLISAYDVDSEKLEEELSRVNKLKENDNSAETKAGSEDSNPQRETRPHKRLQPPRGGFNLCVLVGKVNVVVDKLRVDRSRVRLAEVEVGDETGTVSLRARDNQIDVLEQVSGNSGAVVLRNCTLELYQGKHIRLAVTKWGKLSVYPDGIASTPNPPLSMNTKKNFSLMDLTLIANEVNPAPAPGVPPVPQEPLYALPEKHAVPQHMMYYQQTYDYHRNDRVQHSRSRSGGQEYQHPAYTDSNLARGMMQVPAFGASYTMDPTRYGYRPDVGHGRPIAHQHMPSSGFDQMHQLHLEQMQLFQERDQRRTLRSNSGTQMSAYINLPHTHASAVESPRHFPNPSFDSSGEVVMSQYEAHPPHDQFAQNAFHATMAGQPEGGSLKNEAETIQDHNSRSFLDSQGSVQHTDLHSGGSYYGTPHSTQRTPGKIETENYVDAVSKGKNKKSGSDSGPMPRAGEMNPQAPTFAPPGTMKTSPGGTHMHQMAFNSYTYPRYDPSRGVPGTVYGMQGMGHPMYGGQGVLFVPAVPNASLSTPTSREVESHDASHPIQRDNDRNPGQSF